LLQKQKAGPATNARRPAMLLSARCTVPCAVPCPLTAWCYKQYGAKGKLLFNYFTLSTLYVMCPCIFLHHYTFFVYIGNTAQFPPDGLSTAPAAAARHLRCQNAR